MMAMTMVMILMFAAVPGAAIWFLTAPLRARARARAAAANRGVGRLAAAPATREDEAMRSFLAFAALVQSRSRPAPAIVTINGERKTTLEAAMELGLGLSAPRRRRPRGARAASLGRLSAHLLA